MAISIEFTWGESVSLGEIEDFVVQAKAGGAFGETMVEQVTPDQDPQLQIGWRVAVGGDNPPATAVPLPHRMMWDIQDLLERIAGGDGDIREFQAEVIKYSGLLRERLVDHVAGRL